MDDLLAVIEALPLPFRDSSWLRHLYAGPHRYQKRHRPYRWNAQCLYVGAALCCAGRGTAGRAGDHRQRCKCAAAAEGWTGALAGVENGLVLVLGTGIGGGIILNGKVLMGAHAAAGEVSGLVSDISKMADDDFKLTSVERYSEAPLWAGMASASGLIFEYARQKHLPTGSPCPPGKKSLRLTMPGSRKRRRLSRSLPGGVGRWHPEPAACAGCGKGGHRRRYQRSGGSAACDSGRVGLAV